MDMLSVARKIFLTPVPSPLGCSAPDESCLAKNGIPTFGAVDRTPPDGSTYDYSDPNRQAVTWKIGVGNCDGSAEGLTVTADFGTKEGTETGTIQKDPQGRTIAVISHMFSAPFSGQILVTVKGQNGQEIKNYIYAPSAPPVQPAISNCLNYPNVTVAGSLEMNPRQPIVGQQVTFSYQKKNIKQCNDIYGNDPASTVEGYISDLTEKADDAIGASFDQNGIISRSMTFPKGNVSNIYVVVTDRNQPNSIPQMLSTGSFYVKEDVANTCQNTGQSAALTATGSAPTIVRGRMAPVTYTATAVRDSCNQPVKIAFDKLAQLFLPGYTADYDQKTMTLSVTGVVRDDISLPSPVELPYTDQTGTMIGAVDLYPPVRTMPAIKAPADSLHANEPFTVFIDPALDDNDAAIALNVIDPNDPNKVPLATVSSAKGQLIVPLSGNYKIVGTVTPKNGDTPYELAGINIVVYNSVCKNSGLPASLTAARSIDTILRGQKTPVTYTATAVHDECNKPVTVDFSQLDQLFVPGYTTAYDDSAMTLNVSGVVKDSPSLPSPVELPFVDETGKAAGSVKFYPPTRLTPEIKAPADGSIHSNVPFTVFTSPAVDGNDADIVLKVVDPNDPKTPLATLKSSNGLVTVPTSGNYRIVGTVIPKNGDAPYDLTGVDIVVYNNVTVCENTGLLSTLTAVRSSDTIIRGQKAPVTFTATAVHDNCNQAVEIDYTKLDQLLLPGYTTTYDTNAMTLKVTGLVRDDLSLPSPLEVPFRPQGSTGTNPDGGVGIDGGAGIDGGVSATTGIIKFYPPTRTTPVIKAPLDGTVHPNEAFTISADPAISDSDGTMVLNVIDPNKPNTPLATLNASSGQVSVTQSGNLKITGTVTPKNGDTPYDLDAVAFTVYNNVCKNDLKLETLTAARSVDTIIRGANTPVTYTVAAVHDTCNQPVNIDYSKLNDLFIPGYSAVYDSNALSLTISGVVKSALSLPSPVELAFNDQAAAATGAIKLYPPVRTMPKIIAPTSPIYVGQSFPLSIDPAVPGAVPTLSVADLAGNEIASFNNFSSNNLVLPFSSTFKATATVKPSSDAAFALDEVNLSVYGSAPAFQGLTISPNACTRGTPQSGSTVAQCPSAFIVNFQLRASSVLGLAGIHINFGDGDANAVDFQSADGTLDQIKTAPNTYTFPHQFDTSNAATFNVTGTLTDVNSQSTPLTGSNSVSIY